MKDEQAFCTTDFSDPSGSAPGFAIEETWVHRTVVLMVSGDVDMLSAPALTEAIRSAARHGPTALIVDLSAVPFLASAGMNVLVTTQEQLAPAVRFGVVADGPATSRPLRMVGVDRLVPLYRTLSEALVGRTRPGEHA
jgi:anti-anti-sigma factor